MTTCEATTTIPNKLGLHARAAAKLVNLAGQFEAQIEVSCNGKQANAKSIMAIMMLAATKGTEITVTTEGSDADDALKAVVELIDGRFGEPE